ncbi:MAG: SCO family protein [Planctomycetota bacterium]
MPRRPVLAWLAILFIFSGCMLFWFATQARRDNVARQETLALQETVPVQLDQSHGEGTTNVPAEAEWVDFELTDQYGRPFNSDELKGKVWVGGVFFSSCTSVCRAQNQQMAKLQQKFADRGVELVAITCDPDRDTPQALGDYARLFNAKQDTWHFLTGDFELIKKIGQNMFGLPVEREVHSDRLVIFDPEGNNRGAFRSIDVNQFEELLARLDEVVAESEGTEEEAADADVEAGEPVAAADSTN